ncbi:MAG TPA: beta-ketoacyl synthase N-terminal-like domain-containing protein, partial [Aggregatilineales bacterium]|nr:beta-ketoacyl synthase N-terminal-like domain-containing protein [Aggregatilineales bacterium]
MEHQRNNFPRPVITGLGAVTALGDVTSLWDGLKNGQSGIRKIETIEVSHVPVRIAGEVRGFDASTHIDRKEARRMGRASQFAVLSAIAAVEDAGLTHDYLRENGERVGVVIGTSLGCHEMSEQATTKYKTSG